MARDDGTPCQEQEDRRRGKQELHGSQHQSARLPSREETRETHAGDKGCRESERQRDVRCEVRGNKMLRKLDAGAGAAGK